MHRLYECKIYSDPVPKRGKFSGVFIVKELLRIGLYEACYGASEFPYNKELPLFARSRNKTAVSLAPSARDLKRQKKKLKSPYSFFNNNISEPFNFSASTSRSKLRRHHRATLLHIARSTTHPLLQITRIGRHRPQLPITTPDRLPTTSRIKVTLHARYAVAFPSN